MVTGLATGVLMDFVQDYTKRLQYRYYKTITASELHRMLMTQISELVSLAKRQRNAVVPFCLILFQKKMYLFRIPYNPDDVALFKCCKRVRIKYALSLAFDAHDQRFCFFTNG